MRAVQSKVMTRKKLIYYLWHVFGTWIPDLSNPITVSGHMENNAEEP